MRGASFLPTAACVFLATAPLLAAKPNPPAKPPSDVARPAPTGDYLIGVEDVLSVSVWKQPELTRTVNVRPDGKITFPLLGDMQAAGRTPVQLAAELTETLVKYVQDPIVTVTVEQINSYKIYLLGEIGKQGELTLKRPMRLLQVIAMAGGLSPYASKNVVVVRDEGGREVRTEVDYRKLLSGERPELNIPLKAGDTIIVP